MSTTRPAGRPVALVTGASRGIGRHTALVLAQHGYDVAVTGRTLVEGEGRVVPRTVEPGAEVPVLEVGGSLAATVAEIEAYGGRALAVRMDLSDLDSVLVAVRTVHDTWGPVAVLVNNGYVHRPHQRLLDLDDGSLRATWEGNFLHQVALVREVLGPMVAAGGGLIVGMASSSATTDPPKPPGEGGWGLAYASSKAAFGRIAGAVNAEYAAHGVRAFNVDPGFVVTESAVVRGGNTAIQDQGYASADPAAAGHVIAWLADSHDGDKYLGKTIWAPTLAPSVAEEARRRRLEAP